MYRGREGQWAFIFHRVSGLAILFYLLIHVAELAAAMWGPQYSNAILGFFHTPVFRLALLGIIAAVLYHALNCFRIIFMDFTGWGVKYQAKIWYGVFAVFLVIYIPVLIKILPEIFRGH